MKYTHDRKFNIVPIDIESISKEDLIVYASHRPIWDTKEEAEKQINNYKPRWVSTWAGWMWYWE